jgi:hypothetical protein
LRQRLDAATVMPPAAFSAMDVAELPDPVERFFRHVLREGQPILRSVTLDTAGEFQTGTRVDTWRPFTASQEFSVLPPGFVWDARIRMAPFLSVYVRDAYVDGRPQMRARVWGLYPVVDEPATKALAAGQLHRFLAEMMWFPTALLPGYGVIWEPIDASSAMATIRDGAVSVSLRFTFTPDGDVSQVFALDRMRSIDGRQEPTPWTVRCDDYQVRDGIRIPIHCEAAWILPDAPLPYWRGRVVNVVYHPAR